LEYQLKINLCARKRRSVLWARTIQNASSVPASIQHLLQKLAAQTRKQGYLIQLLPTTRHMFLHYCVTQMQASTSEAKEAFKFLKYQQQNVEQKLLQALISSSFLQTIVTITNNASIQELIKQLRCNSKQGFLCPRNRADFMYYCSYCFPDISNDICNQTYDHLIYFVRQYHSDIDSNTTTSTTVGKPLEVESKTCEQLPDNSPSDAEAQSQVLDERCIETGLHPDVPSGPPTISTVGPFEVESKTCEELPDKSPSDAEGHSQILDERCLSPTLLPDVPSGPPDDITGGSNATSSLCLETMRQRALQSLTLRKEAKPLNGIPGTSDTEDSLLAISSLRQEERATVESEDDPESLLKDVHKGKQELKEGSINRLMWARSIHNAPDSTPDSIKTLISDLNALSRHKKRGGSLPNTRDLFIRFCVKKFNSSQDQSEETFDFLSGRRELEVQWKEALQKHVPLQSIPASVNKLLNGLKKQAQKGILCPRNKADFLQFCNFYFMVTDDLCNQTYDYLAANVPYFQDKLNDIENCERTHETDTTRLQTAGESNVAPFDDSQNKREVDDVGHLGDDKCRSSPEDESSNTKSLLLEANIAARRKKVLQSLRFTGTARTAVENTVNEKTEDRNALNTELSARYEVQEGAKQTVFVPTIVQPVACVSSCEPANIQALTYKVLPKEITALSQRLLIENISASGPAELVRIAEEATCSKPLSKYMLDAGKVGNGTEAGFKRKYATLVGVEDAEDFNISTPLPGVQVEEVRKRSDELQKNIAFLKNRLKEKQKKNLMQNDSAKEILGGPSCVDFTGAQSSASSADYTDKVGVLSESTDERQMCDNAELEGSGGATLGSVQSLRMRQKQLRQTIELNNLKNLSSKQKSLLSEQNARLNESKVLLEECSTEIETYESLVQDGEKRLNELERRRKLLLGMLTKATQNVLAARRNLNEARLCAKDCNAEAGK